MDSNYADLSSNLPKTRGYQQEMLEESLRRNIVIALDTGSGKTHIAVLRLKHEAERQTKKISWFIAPTVGLCEQQKDVITNALPVPVGLISGALNPDQWKDKALWTMVLATNRIIVSTPQVLLDALRHGYVNLAADLGLLVFDEAHHAADKHPYNMILREFYDKCPDRIPGSDNWDAPMKPFILGLTASPIFGGDVSRSFSALEQNMDCIICGPRHTRQELAEYVHRPEFKHVLYAGVPYNYISRSRNVSALSEVVSALSIEEDPFVLSLRKRFNSLNINNPDYNRVDQRLSRVLDKKDSYTHKGLRDFLHAAEDICTDIGVWAADWYVSRVLEHALKGDDPFKGIFAEWQNAEKTYLLSILSEVDAQPVSYDDEAILSGISPKTKALISCLLSENAIWDVNGEIYSGIVFVDRRDSVLALEKVLEHHPDTKDCFIAGCLLGSSSNAKRRSFLDITSGLLQSSQSETLRDFRVGEKNVLVSTAVAEEGIDIQACGNVIRWDLPKNMVSWAQSRGRARRQRSSFIVMLCDGHVLQNDKTIQKWESLEQDMIRLYTKDREEALIRARMDEEDEAASTKSSLRFRVESTGAVLTLDSAVSHLAHFCSVLPVPSHVHYDPVYDIDPPEYPLGYHSAPPGSLQLQPKGPYCATVTLPRLVPSDLRVFRTERIYQTKESARRHVAFKAYVSLYKAGLLNDNLLPLTSVVEPDLEEEVKALFEDVEKRKGVAKVSLQFNPWDAQATDNEPDTWWQSDLLIEGLPTLTFFTRSPLSEATVALYDAKKKRHINVVPRGSIHLSEEKRVLAANYSKYIFSVMHGHKIDNNNDQFLYLLFPQKKPSISISPAHQFLDTSNQAAREPQFSTHRFIDALQFIQEYRSTKDVYLLKDSTRRLSEAYFEFLQLRTTPLDKDEIEYLLNRTTYAHCADKTIQYPLLLARPLPRRRNFLVPYDSSDEKDGITEDVMLLPQHTAIAVAAPEEVKLSILFPSIIRALSLDYIADSLCHKLFSTSSLVCLSINSVKPAIVAPAASEAYDYQRLETLGDTILKFIVCLQLIAEYPLWHEGYLTRRKDHTVNNAVLAKAAVAKELYKWIIRDRFVPRRWRPHYIQEVLNVSKEDDSGDEDEHDESKSRPTLSIKVLADVVEALIGVSYLEGGLDYSIECARIFKLNVPWKSVATRISEVNERTEDIPNVPYQLQQVETMLGYRFNQKAFLVEALMHASYHSDISTVSYERMEFLGDSILDMIIVEILYSAPGKNYPPGHMHIRKSALTNKHFLGFICLGFSMEIVSKMPEADEKRTISIKENKQLLYLWQCLLHSSSRILDDLRNTFDRYEKYKEEIETGLLTGTLFPWAALTRLQAPKFFGDMIESIIAAVYLDSSGDVMVVKKLLDRLGILPIVSHVIDDNVDVRHPVSRVSNWAQKYGKTVEYEFTRIDGNISCVIFVDEEEITSTVEKYNGKASQESAKFRAAEVAITILSSQIEET